MEETFALQGQQRLKKVERAASSMRALGRLQTCLDFRKTGHLHRARRLGSQPVFGHGPNSSFRPPNSDDSTGTTTLELLVDFVLTTSTSPPVCRNGAASSWTELTGTTLCFRTTVQDWTQLLMKTERQLERQAARFFLRTGRRLERSLGETTPRKGVQRAALWCNAESLHDLLVKTLESGDILAMLRSVASANVQRGDVDSALNVEHEELTAAARCIRLTNHRTSPVHASAGQGLFTL